MEDNIKTLESIFRALDNLEVKGRQNHAIVIACMNDIERIVKSLKEGEDGNLHD